MFKVFASQIQGKITSKVQADLIQPVTSGIASWGVEKVSKGLTDDVNRALEGFRTQNRTHHIGKQFAKAEKDEKQEGQTTAKELNRESQQKIKDILEDKMSTIADVPLLSKAIKRPIVIYKNGKVFDTIGSEFPGEPLHITHTPEGVGHWAPYDTTIQVEVSGKNNCLHDTLVALVGAKACHGMDIKTGADLRKQEIEKNPALANELMREAAKLSILKPTAMMEGGREYNINVGKNRTPASKEGSDKGKYRTEYVSEEGGNEIDYLNYGYYDDKGAFVALKREEIERGKGSIITIRFKETDKSTVSILLVPGDDKEKDIKGYGLEPSGPSTSTRNINRRILPETYSLLPHSGNEWEDTFKLYNNQLNERAGILIHPGNYHYNTKGCLMFGDSYQENGIVRDKEGNPVIRPDGNPERDNVISSSGIKVEVVKEFIRSKGYKNVKVHILEEIPDKKAENENK